MSLDYPTWDRAADYEIAAVEAVENMRAAITDNQPGGVVDNIDAALKALHQLRQAAVSENRRRQDELWTRISAEDAARRARPAVPPPDVVAEVQQLVADKWRVRPIKLVRDSTSMTLAEAVAYVEAVTQ